MASSDTIASGTMSALLGYRQQANAVLHRQRPSLLTSRCDGKARGRVLRQASETLILHSVIDDVAMYTKTAFKYLLCTPRRRADQRQQLQDQEMNSQPAHHLANGHRQMQSSWTS